MLRHEQMHHYDALSHLSPSNLFFFLTNMNWIWIIEMQYAVTQWLRWHLLLKVINGISCLFNSKELLLKNNVKYLSLQMQIE
jgi:hypothetical protein